MSCAFILLLVACCFWVVYLFLLVMVLYKWYVLYFMEDMRYDLDDIFVFLYL